MKNVDRNKEHRTEYERLTKALVTIHGSQRAAAKALGLHRNVFVVSEAMKLTPGSLCKYKDALHIALQEHQGQNTPADHSAVEVLSVHTSHQRLRKPGSKTTQPNQVIDQCPHDALLLPDFDPGQSGIDFAVKMIRLTTEILHSFSSIRDQERRHAVRNAIETDVRNLLSIIRIHTSEDPAQMAKLFGGEQILSELGIGQHTAPEKPRRVRRRAT